MKHTMSVVCVGICTIAGLAVPHRVAAAEGITITPFVIDEEVAAGKIVSFELSLTNNQDTKVVLKARSVDFAPSTSGDGVPRFLSEEETSAYGLKDWIETIEPLTVKPGERGTATVNISVPATAAVGGHYGAVLFGQQTDNQDQSIASQPYVGCLLLLTVEGDIHRQGRITSFTTDKGWYTGGEITFTVSFANSGNVHLRPHGTIELYDVFDRTLAEVPINQDLAAVMPAETRSFIVQWQIPEGKIPYANIVEARLELRSASDGTKMQGETTIWIVPALYIIGAFVLAGALGIGVWYWRRRYHRVHV
jgi:hypothetical protein